MHMEYGCKFRIYPDKEQEQKIKKTFGCCRLLYNHFLIERRDAYEAKKASPSKYNQTKEIPGLKR